MTTTLPIPDDVESTVGTRPGTAGITAAGKLLSLTETGLRLGVSKSTVQRLIRDGQLKATRIRRRTLVHPDDLAACIDSLREMA